MTGRPSTTLPPTQTTRVGDHKKPLKHMRVLQHTVSYHKMLVDLILWIPGHIASTVTGMASVIGAGSVSLFNMADAGDAGD